MKFAEQILQHEASGPRARVDRREDEKGFEQNGEVIPERHHGLSSDYIGEDLRHAHRQSGGAAGTGNDGVLAHIPCGLREHLGGDIKAPLRDRLAPRTPL